MSEVSIEAETTINEVPQRLATVKVYRNGTVTAPDFSLKVPLSSAGNGGGSFSGYNTRLVFEESTIFTAPVEGWYRVTCIGGGGAGGNGGYNGKGGRAGTQGESSSFGTLVAIGGHSGGGGKSYAGGGGGAAGEVVVDYIYLHKNNVIDVIVGRGGKAAPAEPLSENKGENGSDGALGGGQNGAYNGAGAISRFGSGNGGGMIWNSGNASGMGSPSGIGGSNGTLYGGGGGGGTGTDNWRFISVSASGGANGKPGTPMVVTSTYAKGGDGGDGAVIVEYYDPKKK
jgi:hypothetical protein